LKETSPDCRVIAVEPNPREYTVLCENLRRNNIDTVVHENLAVAASGGTLRMEVIPEIGAIGGERVRIPERPWIKNEFVRILEVPAISLDELFSKHDVRTVDVLKIDVEGLEYEILKVCTKLSHVARIVVEYHDVNLKDKLLNLLEDKYFSCVKVDPSGSNPYSGDLYFVNNTFVSG
jgi:FkbM family methyltransferase